MHSYFKSVFKRLLSFDVKTGIGLIILLGTSRFWIVLSAYSSSDNRLTSIFFITLIALPFVLLTKLGRREIGWHKSRFPWRLMTALISGVLLASLFHLLGQILFGMGEGNWFSYISSSYAFPGHKDLETWMTLSILLPISMTLSPFGEELFYRGLVHRCFSGQLGEINASRIDSSAFAITHLCHFGIIWTGSGFEFLFLPSLLWVIGMYLTSRWFYWMRIYCGGLGGAIAGHAGFNAGMTLWIVYAYL